MTLELDSEIEFSANEDDCRPVAFVPDVNLAELEEPSIIEAF